MANVSRIFLATKKDGQEVRVYEYSSEIDVSHMGSKIRRFSPGSRWLELEDGSKVNFIDDQTFQIVSTGERLTRKD